MSKKCLVILDYKLNTDQIKDLEQYDITEKDLIYLPKSLRNFWSNISPEETIKEMEYELNEIKLFILRVQPDYIIIQGEMTCVYHIVSWVKLSFALDKCSCLAATSKRETIETASPNGEIIKKSIFKHCRFRLYE